MCLRANHLIVCNDQQSAIMITDEWRKAFENYWEDNKDNPFAARDHIIASISPQVSLIIYFIFLQVRPQKKKKEMENNLQFYNYKMKTLWCGQDKGAKTRSQNYN